jgi:lipoyl-dependent peroxiredoxin subunit C
MPSVDDEMAAFALRAVVSLERGRELGVRTNQSYPGKWLARLAWPMDFTFVCPTEIAEFGWR